MRFKLSKIVVVIAVLCTVIVATTPQSADALGSCRQYEQTMRAYAPRGGWNVSRMSGIAYRESRCIPTVVNKTGRDTGLFQVHPTTWPYLSAKFHVPMSRMQAWLKVPVNNVRAAAKLCEFARRAWGNCYQPWVVR